MKNVNELVLKVQAEGKESFAWVDLFETINKQTIEPKTNSFSSQLKGDVQTGISEGWELLMDLVKKWDGTGNFHSLFKTSFDNRLKNLVKHVGRNKRKHNTSYQVSLSESANAESGESSPILEVTTEAKLHSSFDVVEDMDKPSFDSLLDAFSEKYPEKGGIIDIMVAFPDDSHQAEKTEAFAKFYGSDTYTSAIQRRVSRVRESFDKFLENNGYYRMS
jgi:hypothetical protein